MFNLEQALEAVRFCNSYNRMETVLGLYRSMSYGEWLQVLGNEWCCCDNHYQHQAMLRKLLPDTTAPEMMTTAEISALAKLPEIVTVYRGADFHLNVLGLSWSLEQSMARQFPTLFHRHLAKDPVLIKAPVPRHKIIAYKLERGESEVITKDVDVVAIESLRIAA